MIYGAELIEGVNVLEGDKIRWADQVDKQGSFAVKGSSVGKI